MAIQVVTPPTTIAVGDTIPIHVRVLNRNGDSIIGAPVVLISLNPDTLGIDTARTAIIGRIAGVGRYVARTGTLLPSAPLPVTVQ